MTKFPLKSKKFFILLFVFIIAGGIAGFYFFQKKIAKIPRPAYNQVYRLVPEKISQSAPIRISLPPKISLAVAEKNIKFLPKIEGDWSKSDAQNEIIFKPKQKLNLNRYYGVELLTEDKGRIYSDFLVVDDPEIVAIFPIQDSEAPENSEITIVFNRPMVPLTTLGFLEEKEVPVEITPPTEGKFKWITTKNLQFIPRDRLKRSSGYTVKIKPGLVSMDGLTLKGAESKFTTRHLRNLGLTEGKIGYNQPISISFNQPVDLEKIKKEIILKDTTTGKEILFAAEYEAKSPQNQKGVGFFEKAQNILLSFSFNLGGDKKELENFNQSVIKIYNREDRFGRKKLWDFEANYSLLIRKAYPLEGDINLDQGQETKVYVAGIIDLVTAESEKTHYATPEFFDPQGKIWVSFYEEIDLAKSKIKVPYLKEIGYGQKCRDENLSESEDVECEKIPDKKRIYLIFDSSKIGLEERLEINFEAITNIEGLTINKEPIKRYIVSYPQFKILRTIPESNASGASIVEFFFCSNTPILPPQEEEYKDRIRANLDYEFYYWGNSQRVDNPNQTQYLKCNVGEFSTKISYGLIPESNYSLDFKLEDVFGQKISHFLKFTTGKMPEDRRQFHQLQPDYNVTTPKKTQLTFAVQNLEYVNLEICKLDPLNFLGILENKPSWYASTPTADCKKIIRDKIDLPKRYWLKNYFKVDPGKYFRDPIGHFILTFSHPNYTSPYWEKGTQTRRQAYERSYLTVTNLGLAEKRINLQTLTRSNYEPLKPEEVKKLSNLYWVTNLATLEPVSDAKINLYRKSGNDFILSASSLTDGRGIATPSALYDLAAVIASKGNDSAIIPVYESDLNYSDQAFSARRIYLYTDKPIYRPEHEVFIKGIYRLGYDGNYEIFQDKKVNLKVYNSKDDEILNQDLEVNDFGTFNTKFILDKDSPLGTYRVCALENSCSQFEVQEYVPAPFKVEVTTDKEEYISKDTANIDVAADYYFGVPLEGGETQYTISSQNYYFDRYSDASFDYDSGWYYWPPYSYGEKFILRGSAPIGKDGKVKISQTFDLEKLFKTKEEQKSKIIVLDVTVKNTSGQSVSAQKSFIIHQGEFYLNLASDKYFLGKSQDFNLKVKSVDIKGNPILAQNLALNVYELDWIHAKRQEATGGYSYKWEKQRKLVKNYNFDTDKEGNFTQNLNLSDEGEYEAEVSGKDVRDNLIWDTSNFYIWGPKQVSVEPQEGTSLQVEAEKTFLNVGQVGEIIIKSPEPKSKALITIERGKIFDYHIKDIEGNLYPFSFEVKEDYIPNVYVSVLLISPKPEIKFTQVEFKVNTERENINIEVKSNKNYYLPGEEVTLDIAARDYLEKPISSEVSVAVVDLSVLALKGNPKKNPLIFFYGGFPLTVATASNVKNILVETKIPTKGGGGLTAEELAKKKRGIFKETAFWQAVIRTDENGKAQVKFTLPDNLTTWQTETLGVTKDTKLGTNYLEFITRKELMVVPLKPRFIVPGDVFFIGAKIFNQSKTDQKLRVTLASPTLFLKDDIKEKEIFLKQNDSQTLYFQVQAPPQIENGRHTFTLSAIGQGSSTELTTGLEDTVEQTIKITRNDTYETTATSDYTSEDTAKEYVFLPDNIVRDKGSLTVKSSATLAVFLSDALNYLLGFPYGCSEQIASKLNAIAIVKKGLNLPNIGDKFNIKKVEYNDREYTIDELVEIGLAKLYNNQRGDGGFALWQNYGDSSFHTTLHVVDTLNNLKKAGYKINQGILDRAANYLYNQITSDYRLYQDRNNVILAAYTLYNLESFRDPNRFLKQKIIELIGDDLFLKEQTSNTTLAYLGIIVAKDFDAKLKKKVLDTLNNRISIDARGAFLETNKNFLWYYFETPIKNTALYLKALATNKSKNPITEKVLRWLLASRQKDGAWGSTNNTLTAIDALTDYLGWKKETESNFILNLFINDKSQDSFHFKPETILDQSKKEIPLKDLKFNENNLVLFSKENKNKLENNFYYDMALKYYLPQDQIPPRDEGFSITRELYSLDDKENKNPIGQAKVGEVARVHLQITVPTSRNFVAIEDYIPAGMEIVNLDLATEQKSLLLQESEIKGRELYPNFKELRDDRAFLFSDYLGPGVYEYDYYVRALIPGKFTYLPAIISEMYFPENFGRTDGRYFEIK